MENKTMQIPKGKEYVLAYGFRRWSACKKLGWKTIPAFIIESKESIELPIDKIFVADNTRLQGLDEGFEELMTSIKHHGLLQPIGVWEGKDLTEEQFMILNLTENIHRQDISPMELAKAIKTLENMGLTRGQIAVRLALPKSKIEAVSHVNRKVPQHIIAEMSFLNNRRDKAGKLPFSVVQNIANLRITKQAQEQIIDKAKKEEMSVSDINTIGRLISAGMTASEAISNKRKYIRRMVTLILDKEELDKAGYNSPIHRIIEKMLKGQMPLNPKLFYTK